MIVNLISWEDCKELLDVPYKEKTFIELLIFSASAEIETYTNRKLRQRELCELHDGYNQNEIIIEHYPVKEIISLKVDNECKYPEDTIVSKDFYNCHIPSANDDGEYQSEIILAAGYAFPKGRNNIEVIYNAGYKEEDTPVDLKTAAAELVEWTYKRLNNRQIGEVNLKYGQKTQLSTKIPDHVRELLEPYRRKNW